MICEVCKHEHTGAGFAFICIGCPCPEMPGAPITNIIANGKPKQTPKAYVSYQEALDLVFPLILERRQPTLTWKTRDGRAGTLTPGQYVNVSEGMVFNAAHTGNA